LFGALALIVSCFWQLGCGSSAPFVWASQVPPAEAKVDEALRPGDHVQVVVFGQDTLSGEFEIRPAGDLVLPVAGRVVARGKTLEALAAEVSGKLRGALANPKVTIVIASRRPPNVSVIGEITTPGRYDLREGDGVLDALARAGGFTTFADRDKVFVLRRVPKTERIRFRYQDLIAAVPSSVGFELRDGDVVVVE
jgi:polysaccharide export outer membrane protein